MRFYRFFAVTVNLVVLFVLQYLYNSYFPSDPNVSQAIAFVPAAGLALSALSVGKGLFQSKGDDVGERPKFEVPKSYDARVKRLKTRAAMGGKLPGQDRMEQRQSAITSRGINALEAAPSATYTSSVAKFLEQERDANIGLGIKAAERKDKLQDDINQALKDKETYELKAYEAELDQYKDEAAASRAKKEAGWANIMGGAQLGLSALQTAGIGMGGGGGVPAGTTAPPSTDPYFNT